MNIVKSKVALNNIGVNNFAFLGLCIDLGHGIEELDKLRTGILVAEMSGTSMNKAMEEKKRVKVIYHESDEEFENGSLMM